MIHLQKNCLVLAAFLLSAVVFSQNTNSKWFFGQYAGLNFLTTPPASITGSLITQEGCASVADAAGNLLFYTDGNKVWNQMHNVMANGTGLAGNFSCTQAALIVKKPGSAAIYYIFTPSVAGTLEYSVVDMSLAAGMGSVTVKNTVIAATNITEKLTGTYHCNGRDVWVVTHTIGNNFLAFLVTSSGVNPVPIQSSQPASDPNFQGSLKFSPNGRKLAMAVYTAQQYLAYDFDNTTGTVSNELVLMNNVVKPYGLEFSSDGRILYATRELFPGIFQMNLCPASGPIVIDTILANPSVIPGALQLAIDGKIYFSRYPLSNLGVINNPNVYGSGCNYVDQGPSIAPNTCRLGLPNFITGLLPPAPQPFINTVNCQYATFTGAAAANTLVVNCAVVADPVISTSWNFGDAASGASNTSTLTNPSHGYTSPGNYTVTLLRTYNCRTDTLKQQVTANLCLNVNEQVTWPAFKLYPNPGSGEFMIDIPQGDGGFELEIYTLLGQRVHQQLLQGGTCVIRTGALAGGVYHYKVLKNSASVKTGRLMMQ